MSNENLGPIGQMKKKITDLEVENRLLRQGLEGILHGLQEDHFEDAGDLEVEINSILKEGSKVTLADREIATNNALLAEHKLRDSMADLPFYTNPNEVALILANGEALVRRDQMMALIPEKQS